MNLRKLLLERGPEGVLLALEPTINALLTTTNKDINEKGETVDVEPGVMAAPEESPVGTASNPLPLAGDKGVIRG